MSSDGYTWLLVAALAILLNLIAAVLLTAWMSRMLRASEATAERLLEILAALRKGRP